MKKKENKRSVFRIIKNTLFVLILVTLVAVIVTTIITRINGETPSLFGYSMFRVSTGSMAPELQVGDVILIQDTDPMTLKAGDIITYDGKEGDFAGRIVTHRVVKAPYKDGKETYILTKGDANSLNDPKVNVKDVRGKLVVKVDILKGLYNFFITPWGLLTIIALVILAFFNEIVIFVKSLFGIGYEPEPEESVEEIIERYQRENAEKQAEKEEEEK